MILTCLAKTKNNNKTLPMQEVGKNTEPENATPIIQTELTRKINTTQNESDINTSHTNISALSHTNNSERAIDQVLFLLSSKELFSL